METYLLVIKVLLVVFFILAVISLFAGLFFLMKDTPDAEHKRTMFALMTRVGFCAIALVILVIALVSGKTGLKPSPIEIDRIAEENKARAEQQK